MISLTQRNFQNLLFVSDSFTKVDDETYKLTGDLTQEMLLKNHARCKLWRVYR